MGLFQWDDRVEVDQCKGARGARDAMEEAEHALET